MNVMDIGLKRAALNGDDLQIARLVHFLGCHKFMILMAFS